MDALAASNAEAPAVSNDLAAIKAIPDRFFNRELSWLTFNQRVLEEARRLEYPLLERLRFLSISGNNLDEFLMVRVAGLAGQVRRHIAEVSIDGLAPQQLAAIRDEVMRLESMQQDIWLELREALEGEGIFVVGDRAGVRSIRFRRAG
jgi:polyphosphate kinase